MTCPECGDLEKGQHSSDCPRIESTISRSESEQTTLDDHAGRGWVAIAKFLDAVHFFCFPTFSRKRSDRR